MTQSALQPVDVAKELLISLQDGGLRVIHRLTNAGADGAELAPWAISQLRVGGTAILPLSISQADDHGLQPNAEIVLWPYTGMTDTPFEMRDRYLLVGTDRETPTKVGTNLERGWLAYLVDGFAFVKWARHQPGMVYLDRGASAQCYSSADFVELETLGPVVSLEPGESAEHHEHWRVYRTPPGIHPAEVPDFLDLDGGNPL